MHRTRPLLIILAAIVLIVVAIVVIPNSSDSDDSDQPTTTAQPAPRVNVGVVTDVPGLATFDPVSHDWAGFDVDLYRWLGTNAAPPFTPVEVPTTIVDRQRRLQESEVDLVVSLYSINDQRRDFVGFAGPYLKTRQGVLVRAGDKRIRKTSDLFEMNVCTIAGSTSSVQLKQLAKLVTIEIGNQRCVERLLTGQVDAFSVDQLVLYGFARTDPGQRLTVVPNLTFGAEERYGIGIRRGDRARCEQLTELIKKFITAGAWDQFFRSNFGDLDRSGYKPDPYKLDRCT